MHNFLREGVTPAEMGEMFTKHIFDIGFDAGFEDAGMEYDAHTIKDGTVVEPRSRRAKKKAMAKRRSR